MKNTASAADGALGRGKSHGDLRHFFRFFHYHFTRKAYKQRLFGPRGAKRTPKACECSPHRPTPESDLPLLPQRNMSGKFCNVWRRAQAGSFCGCPQNGGAHPRSWRLYGVISRFTSMVQWPIISLVPQRYGRKVYAGCILLATSFWPQAHTGKHLYVSMTLHVVAA